MTSTELQLRNSQIESSSLIKEIERRVILNEYGDLISEQDLTKNKVKYNLLQSMLAHSRKQLDPSANQDIKKNMNLIEERVYWRATNDSNTYFHMLFQQLKQTHPNMPETIAKVEDINSKIVMKIKSGDVQVNKRHTILNKSELYALESSFYKRRLSSKKLQLSHKINSLDNHVDYLKSIRSHDGQLDKTSSTRAMYKSVHQFPSDQLQQSSVQTLDAKQFLRKIKKDQEITRAQFDDKKKKEEEKKQKIKDQIEIEKQEERRKRHEELLSSFQSQKELQKERHEQIVKNQIEFQQFQKNYKEKKPLYEIMEEQYQQKQEIEAQQEKLTKLRELYRPHRLEEFEDHYRRYKLQQLKREFKQQEQERLALKKNAFQSTKSLQSNSSMWRGRVHEMIEEELRNQQRYSASEDKQLRFDRQKQYANMVKQNYIPKIDKDKQVEITSRYSELHKPKNLIKIQIQKQEIETEPNSYKIGTDNFEFAKKYNREHKKQEDKVKDQRLQQQSEDAETKFSSQKVSYKNYMKEERVKQQLKKDDPKKDWENQISRYQGTEKVEKVLMAAHQLDIQAHRKEQMIKYGKNVDSNYVEDLDDCYFNSIKAKIALLKNYHQIN